MQNYLRLCTRDNKHIKFLVCKVFSCVKSVLLTQISVKGKEKLRNQTL